jgi:hypothetical protein
MRGSRRRFPWILFPSGLDHSKVAATDGGIFVSIRKLIERALEEARDEFAAIIARKVAEVMGDVEVPARKGRPPKSASAPRASKRRATPVAHARPGKRTRAPQKHMEELRARVLAALESGKTMKRSQILAAAKLDVSEAERVAQVLRRLKDEGLLSMQGQKASATYTLRSGGG